MEGIGRGLGCMVIVVAIVAAIVGIGLWELGKWVFNHIHIDFNWL